MSLVRDTPRSTQVKQWTSQEGSSSNSSCWSSNCNSQWVRNSSSIKHFTVAVTAYGASTVYICDNWCTRYSMKVNGGIPMMREMAHKSGDLEVPKAATDPQVTRVVIDSLVTDVVDINGRSF